MENKVNYIVDVFLKRKTNLWILTVSALVLVIIYLCFAYSNSFTILPKQEELKYGLYNDCSNGGNSQYSNEIISDSLVSLDFKLSEKYSSPYVGLSIRHKAKSVLSLGFSNVIKIEISAEGLKNIGLHFGTFQKAEKNGQAEKLIHYYHQFKLQEGRNVYEINIDKFEIPDWFLAVTGRNEIKKLKPNLKKLDFFNISTAHPAKAGDSGTIKVYAMSFERSNKQLLLGLFGVFIAIFIILLIPHTLKIGSKNNSEVVVTYKPVDVKENNPQPKSFLSFINNNFSNPDLTLEMVAKQSGIPQRNITNEIQGSFGCNFKSYINQIRINESKRLLNETNLNVGEIAFKVGFNNQSHHNRVFKQLTNMSPTLYREQNT